ncbi:MAG: hypothetical protein RDU14_07045 [Melioribacteraceae bacterium]|nr:hypothetical protein [Melioribacteraceae bacterium]
MYDKEIILNILNNIKWSIETILKRSDKIHCYEDFLKDDTGREKLR